MEHSTHFPDAFYRVTIKGFCVENGKLLMIRESDALSGRWELPGGGMDFGEDMHTAFKREVGEEMGLKVSRMSRTPVYVWRHKIESRRIGWFYTMVLAYRVAFEDLHFTPSEECEEIRFVSKEEIPTLKIGGQMTELPEIFNPKDFTELF